MSAVLGDLSRASELVRAAAEGQLDLALSSSESAASRAAPGAHTRVAGCICGCGSTVSNVDESSRTTGFDVFMMLLVMVVALAPWFALPLVGPNAWVVGLVCFWSLLELFSVWGWLWGYHGNMIPGRAVLGVASAVAGFEGCFAVFYYLLSRVQAAYFSVSTATTTGLGDIHPAKDGARLLVTAQMALSLFLVVIALGTAFARFFGKRQGRYSPTWPNIGGDAAGSGAATGNGPTGPQPGELDR